MIPKYKEVIYEVDKDEIEDFCTIKANKLEAKNGWKLMFPPIKILNPTTGKYNMLFNFEMTKK